jgi:hypothetical protein
MYWTALTPSELINVPELSNGRFHFRGSNDGTPPWEDLTITTNGVSKFGWPHWDRDRNLVLLHGFANSNDSRWMPRWVPSIGARYPR